MTAKDVQALPVAEEPEVLKCLTAQQRLYVDARAQGMVPLQAAKAAGYNKAEGNAYRVEQNPKVQAALAAVSRGVMARLNITREDVLEGLMDAVRSAGSSQDLTAAWREIGRIVGAYEPQKIEIELKDLTTKKLQGMSDRDLVSLIKRGGVARVVDEEDEVLDGEFSVLSEAIVAPVAIDDEEHPGD